MANHKSAIKRNRQNIKRRQRNREAKTAVKTLMKNVRSATTKAEAQTILKQAEKLIASSGTKGIFHRKNASRKISRLTQHVNSLQK